MAIPAFTRTVEVFIQQSLAPAAQSRLLAETAKAGVAELIRSRQASPRYTRYVNGVEGAPEDSVKPDGNIVYQFSYLGEVVAYALSFLVQRSPVGDGRGPKTFYPLPYRNSFVVAVDGKPIPMQQLEFDSIDADEVMIYNRQPYSRKVDVQLVGKKRLRFTVPPHLFDDCAQSLKRRFGNFIDDYRVYTIDGGGTLYTLKTGQRMGLQVNSPALIITVR